MISIIIPMYNNAGTIRNCLDSLLQGSFKDFEIILSDDGSSDRTLEVCRQIQDPRIRILVSDRNYGVSHARNRGLDAARGEYVSFVDADDTVTEDYLEKLYALASEHSADWVAAGFSFVDENDPSRTVMEMPLAADRTRIWNQEDLHEALPALIYYNHERATLASVCGGLYRREITEDGPIRFREGLRYGEDTLFNLCFAEKCRSFGYLAERLYRYHQHAGSSTDNLFTKFTIHDFVSLTEKIETERNEAGERLTAEEANYVVSQTFGFLNHNAYLQDKDRRQAFYKTLEDAYWSRHFMRVLWAEIKPEEICGTLQRIRFKLIKGKHYETLGLMQRVIRTVKKRLS